MPKLCLFRFSYILVLVYTISLSASSYGAVQDRKIHIVYMGSLREGEVLSSTHHTNMLQDVVDSSVLEQVLVRSYTRSFNAFAANLTEEESNKLSSLDEVVSVFPCKFLEPQTTGSWNFIGFPENADREPTVESDVIIGVIDTGIWPESVSFSDEGHGPVPSQWNGVCKGGQNFTCNKKIIGARYYVDDDARDIIGHGTHAASIASGTNVKNASFFGIASGTARGGVPLARIAAYKVCTFRKCSEADVLAAFDDAIADGVDIITISVGPQFARNLTNDVVAIGSFHAIEKGILTVNSAGNNGNFPGGLSSVAPWLFSIAASTTDRRIVTKVVLGNGNTLMGNSVNSFELNGTQLPLVYGKDASQLCNEDEVKSCFPGCLDSNLVKGKIVLCSTYEGLKEALKAGVSGAIALQNDLTDTSFVFPFPATVLSPEDFKLIENYVNSTKLPNVNILKSISVRDPDAPKVASFSSKGPNEIFHDILKPDVTAPGVDILAAYSPVASPSENSLDKRSVQFSILSGTSMSCPHVSGAAAYVKTFHPLWHFSAIKSALMTTARHMNATNNPKGEFEYGAGQIDPLKAVNPGLVYETYKEDYITMLCSMGYDSGSVRKIIGGNESCPIGQKVSPKDMNYPSMSFRVDMNSNFSVTFSRKVTNVGFGNSTYIAKVTSPPECDIKVEPNTLVFQELNEKTSFVVTATGKIASKLMMISASLEWSDGTHLVRSPIVIYKQSLFS